jgi:hypothetical protein
MPPTTVPPPGERFNFAQHLLERNAGRPPRPRLSTNRAA